MMEANGPPTVVVDAVLLVCTRCNRTGTDAERYGAQSGSLLPAAELEHVGGGFTEVEHTDLTALQTASQQMSFMMQAADSIIRDIAAH